MTLSSTLAIGLVCLILAPSAEAKQETGVASFYANKFDHRLTANGERFSQRALTAAHRSMAMNTRVRVTNLRSGRSVVVRINDRPGRTFPRARVIDLSRAAGHAIGLTGMRCPGRFRHCDSGVVKVRLTVL